MTSNGCIYRCTLPGDKESNVGTNPLTGKPDKIEFDTLAVNPDPYSHIQDANWEATVSLQENSKPKNVNPNDLQDMGLSSFQCEVIGVIENAQQELASQTMLSWIQTFRYNNNFPFGRFGIRTNDFSTYNTTPTPTSGYMVGYIKNFKPRNSLPRVDFIMRLRFNGDITKLGVIIP